MARVQVIQARLIRCKSAAASFGAAFLNGRAGDVAVGAIDAAISLFGPEHSLAFLALVEPLAGVGGHRLFFGMPAMRTGQCGFKDRLGHGGLMRFEAVAINEVSHGAP